MPGSVPQPTPIIHMTHVTNLPKILSAGQLVATSQLLAQGKAFTNIAYTSIQQQRSAKRIPCGPGGSLDEYVPFYFASRSPMLCAIHNGRVNCEGGQNAIIHLVSTAQQVASMGRRFVFTNGHGIMSYTDFYDDLAQLGEVDWDMITAKYWFDTADDGDRKRRKQAEFLVYKSLAWEQVRVIVVGTGAAERQVTQMLQTATHRPPVKLKTNWYY
jgi:hypothetical protein